MEVKAELQAPYTEEDRLDFIVVNNHGLGYEIQEDENGLKALGYTDEELEEFEKAKIKSLKVTKRVFALALQKLGITYTQLKELIASNEEAQLEWDLCVELYRDNPLLDIMGVKLGVSPDELDKIFIEANNYTELTPAEEQDSNADEEGAENAPSNINNEVEE